MPLTPEDVRNKQFTTVRLREGYDEDEVDAFLDEVEAELTRLLRENEDLRAKLAAATRAAAQNQQQHAQARSRTGRQQQDRSRAPQQGARPPCIADARSNRCPPQQQWAAQHGWPAPAAQRCPAAARGRCSGRRVTGPARWARAPVRWARARCSTAHGSGSDGPGPHAVSSMGPARWASARWADGPMGGPMGSPGQGPGGDSAARVLSLAQQTADQAIAEARSEANKIVGEARSRAEGLERDARAKADALERDAQEKHRVAMGSLESARATLERKVEDLRGFEREYRTRLKSYLESPAAPVGDPGRRLAGPAAHPGRPPRCRRPRSDGPAPWPRPARCAMVRPHHGRQPGHGRPHRPGPSYGGQQQMSPAMTQPMAPVRPQGPSPMQQAPTPMRGFLIDEDDN